MYNLYKRRLNINNYQEKIKIKPLTKEQLFLYFDRLTRFKYPEDKYFRVFSDILIKNIISPSFSKKKILSLNVDEIINYAAQVWNSSVEYIFGKTCCDFLLNKKIFEIEQQYFVLNNACNKYLNSQLVFEPLVSELKKRYTDLPINLKRICDIYFGEKKHLPIQKIVFVEGITEDILLPTFSKLKNFDFDKQGIYVVVSGGKNKIVKQYNVLHNILKIPVFVLFDADGGDVFPQIKKILKSKDEIYMLKSGEFEDIIDRKLILKTLKSMFPNIIEHVSKYDFDENLSTVENLQNYFKINGLGEFKKADFAQNVKDNCTKSTKLTPEICDVLDKIINLQPL